MKEYTKSVIFNNRLKRVISMKLYKLAYSDLYLVDWKLEVNAKAKEIIYYLRQIEKMEMENERKQKSRTQDRR